MASARRPEAYLGRPDINAYNVVLHDPGRDLVAIVCVRNTRVLSPSNSIMLPVALFLNVAKESGATDTSSVCGALMSGAMPVSDSEPRDRFNRETPDELRPVYARCPVVLAAGVVAAAAEASPAADRQDAGAIIACFRAHAASANPRALGEFVDGWARGREALLLQPVIAGIELSITAVMLFWL